MTYRPLVVIIDAKTGKPKRHRRTKRQMAEDRQAEEIATLMNGMAALAEERLKTTPPAHQGVATRIIRKALNIGAGYRPKRGI
jgi:hypothetical protein